MHRCPVVEIRCQEASRSVRRQVGTHMGSGALERKEAAMPLCQRIT